MPRIGVISDTHGLVRPEALRALAGADLIVHSGDVGGPEVLEALRGVAPVVAVRGNNDRGPWAAKLAETEVVETDGRSLYVLHDLNALDLDPRAAGFDAVIAGHSHRQRRAPALPLADRRRLARRRAGGDGCRDRPARCLTWPPRSTPTGTSSGPSGSITTST
jgi:hypothetical protein